MIAGIGRFVEALREEGLDASPAELLDAVRAVERVGVEDRARFRAALRTTLAKGRRSTELFDRLFERYFVPPPRGAVAGKGTRSGSGLGRPRVASAPRPDAPPGARPRSGQPDPVPAPRGRAEAAPRRPGRREGPEPSDAEQVRRALEAAAEGRRAATPGRLRRARLDPGAPGPERTRSGFDPDPLQRDLRLRLTSEDERRIARELPRLIERLRLRRSRRQRRALRGTLWLRRVWRDSLGHGGVPFVLPFRRPSRRRAKVVLLVDVSWSVARAAGFFLWIAAEFLRFGRSARVLLFVDRPVDATEALRRWTLERAENERPAGEAGSEIPGRRPVPGAGIRPGARSFAELLQSIQDLDPGGRSDYGTALHALLRGKLLPGGRDTVLVVLGDARTNRFDPLPWTLAEIAQRTRAVLWLVPESRDRWGSGDSALAEYLPFIDTVVEARNLAGLGRGVAELMRRL